MKIFFLFLFVLISAAIELPSAASAVIDTMNLTDCTAVGLVPSLCGTLHQYSKSAGWDIEEEKRHLLTIFAEGGVMPKHDFIENWNRNIVYGNESPNKGAVQSQSCPFLISENSPQNCITEAWSKTFSIMPAFFENSTYWITPSGKAMAGYFYNLKAPRNVGYSEGATKTLRSDSRKKIDDYNNIYDDCRTAFWFEDESTMDIKMDGTSLFSEPVRVNMGSQKGVVAQFSYASQQPKFESTLYIKNKVFKKSFDWEEISREEKCFGSGENERCYTYIKYSCITVKGIDINYATKQISHTFQGAVKLYQKPSVSHNIVVQNIESTPEGYIDSNAKDYKLIMNNALLHKAGSKYPMEYSYAPYNILFLKRIDDLQYFSEDLYVTKTANSTVHFETFPYNIEECKFVALWPFSYDEGGCTMLKKATTELDLEMDKRHFRLDDPINLKVSFDSDNGDDSAKINIEYGNSKQSVSVNGAKTVSLKPQEGYHSIKASFEGDSSRSPAEAFPEEAYASNDTFTTYLGVSLGLFVIYGFGYFMRRSMSF